MEVILKVDQLVVAFQTESGNSDNLKAVDGVSFELKQGTTLGIVGESGCGKSVTALAVMSLLPKPSGRIESGSILFKGRELVNLAPHEMQKIRGRRISMIFQEPMTALNPVYKIKKQMIEVYAIHYPDMTMRQMIHESVDMLRQVGIASPDKVIDCYPHQLSGGMRQRVMIAMALAPKPDILIADEPTTALDVTVQAQILDLIRDLQEKMGMSVIFITHDLGVIAENCDDAVVMYGGRAAERAGVRELFKNPLHPYTRGLLQSIPALAGTPKSILPTIKGRVPSLEEMPAGCRFSTRCPDVMEICRSVSPDDVEVPERKGHFIACHFRDFNIKNQETHE